MTSPSLSPIAGSWSCALFFAIVEDEVGNVEEPGSLGGSGAMSCRPFDLAQHEMA